MQKKLLYPLIGAGATGLMGTVVGAIALQLPGAGIGLGAGLLAGGLGGFGATFIPSKGERELKKLWPAAQKINALEESLRALSDAELRAKTVEFREKIREATAPQRQQLEAMRAQLHQPRGDHDPEEIERLRETVTEEEKALYEAERAVLDEILPEAFACVREASRRTIGLRHYDVQMIGGMVLHQGKIAEMKTGEGKTLVATLPIYLNALTGRGVHLVTVNDYLARRDVQWMGPIYHALGVSVASIVHEASYLFDPLYLVKDYRMLNLRPVERREAYRADITYGTNHEFGFDYLRDNMKFSLQEYVQRELTYAIVDEVDNILIDEARTPLIISGPAEESTDKYFKIDRVVPRLRRGATVRGDVPQEERAAVEAQGDYTVDEKSKSVTLTEQGVSKVERMLGIQNLYDPRHIDVLHHVQQALKAHTIFQRDVDYIVKDGQVIIVDEFTGRLMPGRRWSDGLHQAVEAKEGVRIERENQTLATITIQNYFRMYRKLGGMTGTADTEAPEFKKIYNLEVLVIPPNKPMNRVDHPDVVYKTEREKFDAVADQIADCYERGQPVLVGTISVEKSEHLSKMLKKRGVKHAVLNAVNHEAEANIIAQAGRHGVVTIATNMAGRGTDILLGGNPEFLARAEMESEWIRRGGTLPQGAQRYEEVLTQLRERFEERIEQARRTYEPLWRPFEEAQGKALEDLTATHREYLEAAFWDARARYESGVAALEGGGAPALRACDEALAAYSDALIEVDRVTGPHFGEEGQNRFARALEDFRRVIAELAADGAAADPRLAAARLSFDRTRLEYERAVQRALANASGDGRLLPSAREAYEAAERAYQEAEAGFTAHRTPYEQEVQDARREYEEERRRYTQAIEEIREQMEKAPAEFEDRYGSILEKYRASCSGDRGQVVEAGGLFIVGTERHESRRIDNQLRGRAGRQGDPGASRFFLSLEDDLLRIFGADRIQGLMERLGMEEGEPIEAGLITRAIANAQSKVEAHNFDIRKHLLEYDDVLNKQREIIYARRRDVLAGENLQEQVFDMVDDVIARTVDSFAGGGTHPEEWDWGAFDEITFGQFNLRLGLPEERRLEMNAQALADLLTEATREVYGRREAEFGSPSMRQLERYVLLQTIDGLWKEHLLGMDHLKEGIGLRGYGQRNPLQEYQKEAYSMFEEMVGRMQEDVVQAIFKVQLVRQDDVQKLESQRRPPATQMIASGGGAPPQPVSGQAPKRDEPKVGRNDPCPCGSGKKYKKCHGA